MKVRRIRTWEDLEALPEGEWVEVEEGMDFTWVDLTTGGTARAIVAEKRRPAKSRLANKGKIPRATARRNPPRPKKGSSDRRPVPQRRA